MACLLYTSAAGRGGESLSGPLHSRVVEFARRLWRPAATVVVVALALLLGWHVFNGKNGISVWQQKRAEERQLRKEIDDLGQENGRLQQDVYKRQGGVGERIAWFHGQRT